MFWALPVVLMVGCQPYLDHEQGLFDFQADVTDFGSKRQLELKTLEGDQSSILLVFNQPLRRPTEDDLSVPFQLNLRPSAPARLTLEGVAGVRVVFDPPLAAATDYTIDIPAGWRAQTGVALWRPIRRHWSTPRPELSQVRVEGQPEPPSEAPFRLGPGQAIELVFNQPVAQGSVQAALSWQPVEGEPQPESWRLEAVREQAGRKKDHKHFRFVPDAPRENTTYRLTLAPGVKGLQGPLRGARAQTFLFDSQKTLSYLGPTKLPPTGPYTLEFSSPVTAEEVGRCLATVPTHARPRISVDPARPTRVRLQFSQARPRRLLLLPGMESQQQQRLEQEVALEIGALPPAAKAVAPLVPIPLSQEMARKSAARTQAWRLSLEQALAASLTAEKPWGGSAALPWERFKPAFIVDSKARPQAPNTSNQLTLKAWPAVKKGVRQGFLALRQGASGSSVQRGLVVDTALQLMAVSRPEGVRVKVQDLSTGRPVGGCSLTLRGVRAAVGVVVKSDSAGEALLPWGKSSTGPPHPLFLVAQRGQDVTFTPVEPFTGQPDDPPPLPVAYLATDRPFYAAGQQVQVGGFLWEKPSRPVSGVLNLVAEDGRLARSVPVTSNGNGFLQASCSAPKEVGLYRVRLEIGDAGQAQAEFRVCPAAVEEEAYSLVITESEGVSKAVLSREGARHRIPGLRAYLLPLPNEGPEAHGWTPLMGHRPAWEPLASALTAEEITFAIPQQGQGGTLVVEAFDSQEPALVLARVQQEVVSTEPALTLAFEQKPSLAGQQTVLPRVTGWQGAVPEISGALMYRPKNSLEWQEAEVRANLGGADQASWNLRFSRPGEYRLLLRATTSVGGPVLQGAWERELGPQDLSDPALSVEPSVASPGTSLVARLGGAQMIGKQVWLSLTGGGLRKGRFATVGNTGALPGMEWSFARSLALTVSAQTAAPSVFGSQRAAWTAQAVRVPTDLPADGQTELSLVVERKDRVQAPPRTGQDLRLALQRGGPGDGWKGILFCSPSLPGWPGPQPDLRSSFLGRSPVKSPTPERYPLLPTEPSGPSPSEISLETDTEIVIPAPSRPGSFRWWVIARDDLGRFAWAEKVAEIGEVSRWSAFLPWGARIGDSFEAGVKFVSGPTESGALGLTATALVETPLLAPSGYLRTAGVVKQGATYLLGFDYQLGQTSDDTVGLAWELGHGGKLHRQDARLEVFDVDPVPRGAGLASLPAGVVRRVPVTGTEPWRLSLRPPAQGDSTIELQGPKGSLGKVQLRAGASPVTLQGGAPGTVEIAHRGGSSITYEMSRLEPDQGETRPWAWQVYLFRHLVDQSGQAVDSAVKGQTARVRLNLVNPAPLRALRVSLPLPGGFRPVALQPVRKGTPSPVWRVRPGAVEFDLEDLEAGEFLWELEAQTLSAGDYLWPTAQATTPDGALQALSGSGRLTVLDE